MKTKIERTAGKRGSKDTVLFADGTRGTTAKAFYSVYVITAVGVRQVGNYRTAEEAEAAADHEQYRYEVELEDEMRRAQTAEYYA